jgi:hypothetical protein
MEIRGKRAICGHVKRGWKTIMAMKSKHGFPVAQVEGVWISDSDAIRDWRARQLRRRG